MPSAADKNYDSAEEERNSDSEPPKKVCTVGAYARRISAMCARNCSKYSQALLSCRYDLAYLQGSVFSQIRKQKMLKIWQID